MYLETILVILLKFLMRGMIRLEMLNSMSLGGETKVLNLILQITIAMQNNQLI